MTTHRKENFLTIYIKRMYLRNERIYRPTTYNFDKDKVVIGKFRNVDGLKVTYVIDKDNVIWKII